MEILGFGVDIVKNGRFKKFPMKKKKFNNKIFTINEIKHCKNIKKSQQNCLAKRFAAKESFVKALGTGFRKNIAYKDIEILNDKYGKPFIKVNSKIKANINTFFNVKNFKIYLSISDEKKYSIANVIISKK